MTTPIKREYPALPNPIRLCTDNRGTTYFGYNEELLHAYADPLLDKIERTQEALNWSTTEAEKYLDTIDELHATIERQRGVMRMVLPALVATRRATRFWADDNPWHQQIDAAITALQAELEKKP